MGRTYVTNHCNQIIANESWSLVTLYNNVPILCHSDLSCLGELRRVTDEFRGAFDYPDALDKNRIVPKGRGVDDEYDAVKDKIAELDADDGAYLKEQKSLFGSNDVRYTEATKGQDV